MKTITVTELRGNIYNLLDEVLETGVPLEIMRGGRALRIVPAEPIDKFANMVFRPDVINRDPAALVHIEWEYAVDLP
jgi:prevent-host-death family protein